MTMPTPEPSPQILTERSASFNRADIKQSARLRACKTTDAGDVESTENLTCPKPSVQHVRHPSLELHPSALHPINLNSKFDHLCSPASPAKAFTKAPVVSDEHADKESSFFSTPHTQGESCSTSVSGETKSPRDCSDFILWGNAAFHLSDARTAATGGTARLQENGSEPSRENHVQDNKQSITRNHMEEILSSKDEGLSTSKDGLPSPDNTIEASYLPTVSPFDAMDSSIVGPQGSVELPSSVGSNLSGQFPSAFRHAQAQLEEPLNEEPSMMMSAEAQSYCRDIHTDKSEAFDASDCTTPTEIMDDSETAPQETNSEGKYEQEIRKSSEESTRSSSGSSLCSDRKDNPEHALIAAEEVKIRAELELEIERDLEREIKTKIYLLSRRLEELTALKAIRQPKEELSRADKQEAILSSVSGQDPMATNVAVPPKSPPSSGASKIKPTPEHTKAEMVPSARVRLASSKKQLISEGEMEKDTASGHGNTPFMSWRKFAIASGWVPHTKDGSSQVSPPPPDASFKNVKISKNSIDGALKPKIQAESTSSFKPDNQNWTAMASSKKFDWIRTLRSDVPSSPRHSSMKTDGEESSAFLPSSKVFLCGNVARTLFTEDAFSTPKPAIVRAQRRGSTSAPRRSVLPSSKAPAPHGDMVALTPPTTRPSKDNLRSASASRLMPQKPLPGNQASRDPIHRNPDPRQVKIATTSKPASMLKASSTSRVSGIERKGSCVGSVASGNQMSSMKNGSATHRTSAIPAGTGTARAVSSKESLKLSPPSKQVSPTSKTSRVAPSIKNGASSAPSIKNGASSAQAGKVLPPSSNVPRRQSSLPLKPAGASRPAFY